VARAGDDMLFNVPMYADGAGRSGGSSVDTAETAVYRDGAPIAKAPTVGGFFRVPAEKGTYKVTVDARRGAPFALSGTVSGAWTFPSGHVDGETPQAIAVLAVRFAPRLDTHNTAPGNREFTFPVQVERQGGAGAATSLAVQVSYDDGATWQKVRLRRTADGGTVHLRHPNGHGYVSLKAAAANSTGNTVEETVIRAYRY
jgi:hypothetical protein